MLMVQLVQKACGNYITNLDFKNTDKSVFNIQALEVDKLKKVDLKQQNRLCNWY